MPLPKVCAFLFLAVLTAAATDLGKGTQSRHVVVVVWDGMRPDFVNPQDTPTLCKLAQEGVTFRNHHAVYLSATHVNGAALETGLYPNHNGLVANYDYWPEIDSQKFVSTEQLNVLRKGDELSHGKYVNGPTIAELVRRAGGRTAVAAAKTVGFLLDRQIDAEAASKAVTLSAGETLPAAALAPIESHIGPFPSFPMYRHTDRDAWTTKALTELFWKDGVPDFSVLWLGEPDLTQHETAPGAPAAVQAIRSSDQQLANVLRALDSKGARATTNIFVVSDHGFSTIERAVDVRKFLADAGFQAWTDFQNHKPTRGDVLLVGNGGSLLFYVIERDPSVTKRLVEVLQQSDFGSVIFARERFPGTFPFDRGQIDSEKGADVVLAFRWNDSKNEFGVPGRIHSDWNRQSGHGTHATLSRFDLHNVLIAAGPQFQRGQTDDLPTGNVDLAPTILQLLNIKPGSRMDGRELFEAMSDRKVDPPKTETERIEAQCEFESGTWHQLLQFSRVGSTVYIDYGDGGFVRKPATK